MNVAQETLGFRRQSFSLCLSLLMSAFALPIPPAALSSHLQRPTERSPTTTHLIQTSCGPSVSIDSIVRKRFGLGRALRRLTCSRKLASPKLVPSTSSLNQVRDP